MLEREGLELEVVANRLDAQPDGWRARFRTRRRRAPSAASRASAADVARARGASSTSATASRIAASRSRRRACSPGTAWPRTSTREDVPFERVRRTSTTLARASLSAIRAPPRSRSPYDFELSTVRFRDFGSDGATVWHEDGLHRVVAGAGGADRGGARRRSRRARRAPRPRRRSPGCSGSRSTLDPFRAWAARDPVLGADHGTLPGFRPTLNPQPFEALVVAITTQQISLRAAAAIRGRFVQRFGVRHEFAWEFPTRESRRTRRRPGLSRARLLSRRRPSTCSGSRAPSSTSTRSPSFRRGGHRRADRAPRARTLDRGLVPRTPPRPPARVARRRPRRAQGGVDVLR